MPCAEDWNFRVSLYKLPFLDWFLEVHQFNQLQAARTFFYKITLYNPAKKFVALYEVIILCPILSLFFFIPFSCFAWFQLDLSAVSDPFEDGISSKRSQNFQFCLRRNIMHPIKKTKY